MNGQGMIGQVNNAQPVSPKTKPSQADYKGDYERYVSRATILIHSPETRESVLGLLGGKDPVQRVANATVMVMQRIDSASRTSGIEVQDTVKMFAAHEIVKLVIELGEAAGKFKLDESLVELALSVSVQDYIKAEITARRINPQQLKVKMDADIRKLPPEERKEIQKSLQRVQQTARKYSGSMEASNTPPEAAEPLPSGVDGSLQQQ